MLSWAGRPSRARTVRFPAGDRLSFRRRPASPLGRFNQFVHRLHRPAQTVRKRTIVVVHGVEFALLSPIDPAPGPLGLAQEMGDFAQGSPVVQRDSIQKLLFQGHVRLSVNGGGRRSALGARSTAGGDRENG